METLAQSVSTMAPTTTPAATIPLVCALAGNATWLAYVLATVAVLRSERDALVGWLRQRGLEVADSDANFVLFGQFDSRRDVWQGLLDRGVLVREVGPPRWLRVTVGTPEEMAAFRSALDEVFSS